MPWFTTAGTTSATAAPGGCCACRAATSSTRSFRFIGTLDLTRRIGGGAIFLSEAVAVVIAARRAAVAPPGSIERRRAAVVGLAFAFLAGHNGGSALGTPLNPRGLTEFLAGPEAITTLAGLPGALALAYAAPRVAGAWPGRARILAWACVLAPLLAGFFDADRLILAPVLSGERTNTRFLWVSAFAIGLAVAVLRYDLGVAGSSAARAGPPRPPASWPSASPASLRDTRCRRWTRRPSV